MSPSSFRQSSYSDSARTAPASEPYEQTIPRTPNRPLGRGRDYRCDVVYTPVPRATTRCVPPPVREENLSEMPPLPRANIHRVPSAKPEENKPETAPLSRATTHPVPPPVPEEIKPAMQALALAKTRQVFPPEPEEFKPEMPRGLIGSLVSWLRGGASARKQLRLVETIPLGEKRFVAIIHAQGRKYLVGGGTAGVALLTSLDEPASQSDSIAPLARPIEVAG